jgi:flagellar biosynthesis protein FlhB
VARPEQTEKATPKRREESRKKGQVPRSTELAGSVSFLAIVLVVHAFFAPLMNGLQSTFQGYFSRLGEQSQDLTFQSAATAFIQAGGGGVTIVLLVFVIAFVVGIAANVAQFGFLFTTKSLKPNFGKLNPITGIQNIFGKRILVQLGKQLLKLFAVGVILVNEIGGNLSFFLTVGQSSPAAIVNLTMNLIYSIAWKFGVLLVIVGVLDYAYERWQLEQNMKMSKQEVKDEYRQAEGNPEAKSAMKKRQRETSRRRMMQAVPRATVVVTNPTHFAVALEWDETNMEAPVVIAKGADLMAKRIRELALQHRIPIMENPPLARTLYDRVEIDQAIPPNLYAGVAQVIAFVYKLKRKTIA